MCIKHRNSLPLQSTRNDRNNKRKETIEKAKIIFESTLSPKQSGHEVFLNAINKKLKINLRDQNNKLIKVDSKSKVTKMFFENEDEIRHNVSFDGQIIILQRKKKKSKIAHSHCSKLGTESI